MWKAVATIAICSGPFIAAASAEDAPSNENKPPSTKSTPKQQLFSGKVVFLREALKRKGVKAFAEFDKQVALETTDGELIPIIPDWRGRAFFQDKRLRERKVDLVGYRRPGIPYLQVLMVFVYNDKGIRQYMDYWCDICAIPMYEIKPCDCCQADIEIRFQTRDLPDYLSTTDKLSKDTTSPQPVVRDRKSSKDRPTASEQ